MVSLVVLVGSCDLPIGERTRLPIALPRISPNESLTWRDELSQVAAVVLAHHHARYIVLQGKLAQLLLTSPITLSFLRLNVHLVCAVRVVKHELR